MNIIQNYFFAALLAALVTPMNASESESTPSISEDPVDGASISLVSDDEEAVSSAVGDEEKLPLAVEGFDVTTYFEEEGPVEGKPSISVVWNDKEWWFASKENREEFLENPVRFAPRYHGHCCQSLSDGKLAKGNPRVFRIVDGRLYLFHDYDRKRMWSKGLPKSRSRSEDEFIRVFSLGF